MKDWKAECDVLRGQIKELRDELKYEREQRERREWKADELRDKFKELLIEVLGR
jgi:predicted nuclease with TOPRIM domain